MAAPTQFTEKAQQAIVEAQRTTQQRRFSQFEPETLLQSLVDQQDGIVPQVLLKLDQDPSKISREVAQEVSKLPVLQISAEASVSKSLQQVLQTAESEARRLGDEYISTEHLLLGISEGNSNAAKLLQRNGITTDRIREALKSVRGSARVTDPNPEGKYQALEQYGRDLTAAAKQGKLDPVIGRDEEIRRVIQVLSRRTKNNPVLIGEPGVGKTAIAEGLAQRIVRGDVPEGLKDKQIISLDMGSLIA
ncbi:MAG: Clp protease N-terminal domain-containing protein, partial [Thermomicrobiales bacterium]